MGRERRRKGNETTHLGRVGYPLEAKTTRYAPSDNIELGLVENVAAPRRRCPILFSENILVDVLETGEAVEVVLVARTGSRERHWRRDRHEKRHRHRHQRRYPEQPRDRRSIDLDPASISSPILLLLLVPPFQSLLNDPPPIISLEYSMAVAMTMMMVVIVAMVVVTMVVAMTTVVVAMATVMAAIIDRRRLDRGYPRPILDPPNLLLDRDRCFRPSNPWDGRPANRKRRDASAAGITLERPHRCLRLLPPLLPFFLPLVVTGHEPTTSCQLPFHSRLLNPRV